MTTSGNISTIDASTYDRIQDVDTAQQSGFSQVNANITNITTQQTTLSNDLVMEAARE